MGNTDNPTFDRIGKVDSDGCVFSERMEKIGRITAGRYLCDNLSKTIGRIDTEGYIYLSNMDRIGRIHPDGRVYDESSNCVGQLDKDIVNRMFPTSDKSSDPMNSKKSDSLMGTIVWISFAIMILKNSSSLLRGVLGILILALGHYLKKGAASPGFKYLAIIGEIILIVLFFFIRD